MINNRADVQSVLSQMRQMRSQMQVQNQPQQMPRPDAVQPQTQRPQGIGSVAQDAAPGMPRVEGQAPTGSMQDAPRFAEMFKSAIDTVNQSQQTANTLRTAYEQGVPGVDLPDVMIAANKAQVSFEATTQVRNRLLEAYKEIMNMPV
ncbi:flagellar hook-basal body complex protein FliE [Natronospirillum operosum]|uniref:Flagellar hook-basal body complex protein FliE n=1 Tax=Natronospirillum operosum TaxID=2759953 RepID=A0A4Z0WG23_9GAMM|nr:flagellar hook-basal body complex protein FliE [Natronospirillum operosum]TGG95980.1 flagellar hook-basal body complex protein FliE [Natronospirillum operosum]